MLARRGLIFGSSARAIVLGSFLVRGDPDKPLLIATGRTTGFGFLTNVAINPHATSAQRDAELVNVVDAHPEVLGLGIEDDAAICAFVPIVNWFTLAPVEWALEREVKRVRATAN